MAAMDDYNFQFWNFRHFLMGYLERLFTAKEVSGRVILSHHFYLF
jgi:hypothetical protein